MYVENLPREITEKIPAPESLLQQSGRSKASNFIQKKTPAQAPSRESRETPKNVPHHRTPPVAASEKILGRRSVIVLQ